MTFPFHVFFPSHYASSYSTEELRHEVRGLRQQLREANAAAEKARKDAKTFAEMAGIKQKRERTAKSISKAIASGKVRAAMQRIATRLEDK